MTVETWQTIFDDLCGDIVGGRLTPRWVQSGNPFSDLPEAVPISIAGLDVVRLHEEVAEW